MNHHLFAALALLPALALAACSQQANAPQQAAAPPPTAGAADLLACPDGTMTANCTTNLQHIMNRHCSGATGVSQWAWYYCDAAALTAACNDATTNPAALDGTNCFATGEEGEIVGRTSSGQDTNCYEVRFNRTGLGKVSLATMFPVADSKCS